MSCYAIVRRQERACGWVENDYRIRDGAPLLPSCDVDDAEPINTGLVSSAGAPIRRLPNPIGFGRDGEW